MTLPELLARSEHRVPADDGMMLPANVVAALCRVAMAAREYDKRLMGGAGFTFQQVDIGATYRVLQSAQAKLNAALASPQGTP